MTGVAVTPWTKIDSRMVAIAVAQSSSVWLNSAWLVA